MTNRYSSRRQQIEQTFKVGLRNVLTDTVVVWLACRCFHAQQPLNRQSLLSFPHPHKWPQASFGHPVDISQASAQLDGKLQQIQALGNAMFWNADPLPQIG